MTALRVAAWTVGVAVVLYVGFAAAVTIGQRRSMYFPLNERPRADRTGIPGLQEVTLRTADGLELLAWWLPPKEAGAPVLAYFHGNGGSLVHRVPRLRTFAGWGWGVLMPEYRGYGGNPGSPSEEGFALDAAAAIAFLEQQRIAPELLAVYGESIGTGVAVRAASERKIGALVLESPFTSLADIAKQRFPVLPVDLLMWDRFDSGRRIGGVHAPLLVVQGARDAVVPPELGRKVLAAANPPKELWVAPDGGHEDLAQHGAMEAVAAFLQRVLRAP